MTHRIVSPLDRDADADDLTQKEYPLVGVTGTGDGEKSIRETVSLNRRLRV